MCPFLLEPARYRFPPERHQSCAAFGRVCAREVAATTAGGSFGIGAVAYIGCNTGGQPCGVTLLEGFVQALHDLPQPTLGECWTRAIDHLKAAKCIKMTGKNVMPCDPPVAPVAPITEFENE